MPEQAIGYFVTNATRMQYPTFRAQGMQISSGIVEATCKTVVSTRTKRSGKLYHSNSPREKRFFFTLLE